jgi:hypothetical protein
MTWRHVGTASFALTLLTCTMHAQTDMVTQAGTVTCDLNPGPGGKPPGDCPFVEFKPEFGALPNISLSFSQVDLPGNYTRIAVTAPGLTTKGFTPIIRVDTPANPGPAVSGDNYEGPPKVTPANFKVSSGLPKAQSNAQQNLKPLGIWTVGWVAVGAPPPVKVVAVAKYIVLTVIYAPPGTSTGGGAIKSSVAYASGSQYGTTTSASHTFKQGYSVEVSTGADAIFSSAKVGLSFSSTKSKTDSQSLQITNSSTSTLTQPGPPTDGISHDRDRIYLLLNPTVEMSVTASSITWSIKGNENPHILYVYAGNLNGHIPWEKSVKDTLDAEHLTEDDYAVILQRDPLAYVATNIDPSTIDASRYKFITSISYEPPLTSADPAPVQSYVLSTSSISTTGSSAEDDYKVTLSFETDAKAIATGSLKASASWEWTNSSSHSVSAGTSESATATIGSPANGYVGSNYVMVYYDTIYRTFAFSMLPTQTLALVASGTVMDSSGKPVTAKEVSMLANGITYHTFSDATGKYKFYGTVNGSFELTAKGGPTKKVDKAPADVNLAVQ